MTEVRNYIFNLIHKTRKDPNCVEPDILSILQQKSKKNSWTEEEKKRYLAALREHGRDFGKITAAVGGKKTNFSVRNNYYRFLKIWEMDTDLLDEYTLTKL